MRYTTILSKRSFYFATSALVFVLLVFSNIAAQSSNQLFPTPITTNEVSGKIKARDIGDSRLTTYYFLFNGGQGDIFINVVTSNFNGDIDIFSNEGAKTLSKIVIYADASDNETGRVIYLRKPEKLLLRIEGRSPNDDDATFRIKFAGSFQAITNGSDAVEEPKLPEIKKDDTSGIRVNSVGTIVAVIPKPAPQPKENSGDVTEIKKEVVKAISIETEEESAVVAETGAMPKTSEEKAEEISEVSNIETLPDNTAKENEPLKLKKQTKKTKEKKAAKITGSKIAKTDKPEINNPETSEEKPAEKEAEKENVKAEKTAKASKKNSEKIVKPDPLSNIQLIVLFKDGTKIERPMSEILKVGVDKGILTVISKDGTIGRYSILDVAKMTIE